MREQIFSVLIDLLALLIPILVAVVIGWLKQKYGVERLTKLQNEWDTKQELAMIAVRFAEQAYRDYNGHKKYEQAASYLGRELSNLGIRVSEDTLQGLIESALSILKEEFGEQWSRAVE